MTASSKLNPKAPSFVPMCQRMESSSPPPLISDDTDVVDLEAVKNHHPFIVILIGPPGCGKTTQGRLISKHFGFEFYCVSEAYREAVRYSRQQQHHQHHHHHHQQQQQHLFGGGTTNNSSFFSSSFEAQYHPHHHHHYLQHFQQQLPVTPPPPSLLRENKSGASLLDEKLRQVKRNVESKGIVVEWVNKPDHLVIISETCRRHDLKVGAIIIFEADDIEELVARICHQHTTERPDRGPPSDSILQRIHDYMFVEDTFKANFKNDPTATFISSLRPYEEVTLRSITHLSCVLGHTNVCESSFSDCDIALATTAEELRGRILTPPNYPCLQFVRSKRETLRVLTQLNNFLGMKSGNLRRFPGTVASPIDDSNMKIVCSNNCSKYYLTKKATGARFIALYIKPRKGNHPTKATKKGGGGGNSNKNKGEADETTTTPTSPTTPNTPQTQTKETSEEEEVMLGGWYFIDRYLLVFRVDTYPEPDTTFGDMLLDGVLTTARNKFFFLAFDSLYFNGCSVMGETLDSRLEHLYSIFPPENVMEQQVKTIGPSQVSMLYQNFFPVCDLPRLIRELSIPNANLYHSNALVFASRGTAYKVGLDKNTFHWKPSTTTKFDFRLIEVQPGLQGLPDSGNGVQYGLTCGRVLGREAKELTFDSLDPDCQVEPFSDNLGTFVGKVVECVALAPQQPLRRWQIISLKSEGGRFAPMKEDTVKGLLLTCLTGEDLVILYHQHSQTQPDLVQAPPQPHGSPISPIGRLDNRSPSPTNIGGLWYGGGGMMYPQQARGTYGGGHQVYPGLHPHQFPLAMLHPYALFSSPMVDGPILSNPPVPSGKLLSEQERMQNKRGHSSGRKEKRKSGGGRLPTEDNKENTPHSNIIPFPTKPVKKSTPKNQPQTPSRTSPTRGMVPCTPPPLDQRRGAGVSPTRSPLRSPYGAPRNTSPYRTSPSRVSPYRTGSTGRTGRTPSTPNSHYSRHSPMEVSPARSYGRNDSSFGDQHALSAFVQSVREWIIRKFTPPPSMAKPRPYTVLDLNLQGTVGLNSWDKYRASYCAAICKNEQVESEAKQYIQNNANSELKVDILLQQDICGASSLTLPENPTTTTFDVIVMFESVSECFRSAETCQQFLHMVSSHLKEGGIFLLSTIDSSVFLDRLKKDAEHDTFGNSEYTVAFENGAFESVVSPSPSESETEFGHKFTLKLDNTQEVRDEYLMDMDVFSKCAKKEHLGEVDYGHLNFHEVATYLKKHHLATWLRVEDLNDQCDLAKLFCVGVYKKEVICEQKQ